MGMKDESEITVGEKTPVRLGLLLTILAGVFGGLIAGVWWAATISSKVDTLLESNNSSKAQVILLTTHAGEMQQQIQKLDWRITVLEGNKPAK